MVVLGVELVLDHFDGHVVSGAYHVGFSIRQTETNNAHYDGRGGEKHKVLNQGRISILSPRRTPFKKHIANLKGNQLACHNSLLVNQLC